MDRSITFVINVAHHVFGREVLYRVSVRGRANLPPIRRSVRISSGGSTVAHIFALSVALIDTVDQDAK